MYGAYDTIENRPALRSSGAWPTRRGGVARDHRIGRLVHWFPSRVEVDELRPGAEMTFRFEHDAARGRCPPRSPGG